MTSPAPTAGGGGAAVSRVVMVLQLSRGAVARVSVSRG